MFRAATMIMDTLLQLLNGEACEDFVRNSGLFGCVCVGSDRTLDDGPPSVRPRRHSAGHGR